MKKGFLMTILATSVFLGAAAQEVGLKTNLLYGAYTLTPNLGVEIGLGKHSTIDIGGGYNPWNRVSADDENKKLVHWLGSVEYRYWLCEKFNGHFFGVHALGSQYNISKHELPLLLGSGSEQYRYEGWAAGAGLSYGYQFVLGKHWNAEASIGLGYARLQYDKYECKKCGVKTGEFVRNYFGPTKATLSVIYLF